MRNLIPVKRADKNGVVNTKWVKPNDAPSRSLAAPPPQIFAEESEYLKTQLNIDTEHSGISLNEVRDKARRLPADTSARLLGMIADNNSSYTTQAIIICALHHDEPIEMLESFPVAYSDYVYQELSWQVGSHEAYESITADIRGMKNYPQFAGVDNLQDADGRTKFQASQIAWLHYEADKTAKLTVGTTDDGKPCHYIDYPQFMGALVEKLGDPVQSAEWSDIIYERGFDPEWLKVAFDTTVPLREGAL